MPLLAPSDAASLTQLSLHKNRIGDAGAAAIARVIGDGGLRSLEQLHMADNAIGDEGAVALAQAFTTAKTHPIETLSLAHNNIGDAGLRAFALCLKKGSMRDALFIHLQVLLHVSLFPATRHSLFLPPRTRQHHTATPRMPQPPAPPPAERAAHASTCPTGQPFRRGRGHVSAHTRAEGDENAGAPGLAAAADRLLPPRPRVALEDRRDRAVLCRVVTAPRPRPTAGAVRPRKLGILPGN